MLLELGPVPSSPARPFRLQERRYGRREEAAVELSGDESPLQPWVKMSRLHPIATFNFYHVFISYHCAQYHRIMFISYHLLS